MPDAHRHIANMNAITLADDLTEFDILLPEAALNLNRYLAWLNLDTPVIALLTITLYVETQMSQSWTFHFQ